MRSEIEIKEMLEKLKALQKLKPIYGKVDITHTQVQISVLEYVLEIGNGGSTQMTTEELKNIDETNKLKEDLKNKEMFIDQLKEYNNQLKARIRPFEDSYFNGLSSIEIAELAKKSIRLAYENRKLENALEKIKDLITPACEGAYNEDDFLKIKQIISDCEGENE